MTDQSITLVAEALAWKSEKKPYVARLTGLDRKYGVAREFLMRRAVITEIGIYEVRSFDKKDRPDTDYYLILQHEGGLVKFGLKEETTHELLASGRPLADIVITVTPEGKLMIRRPDGTIAWRTNSEALREERARLVARLAEIDAQLATED